jgi:hypothetical protein
VVDAAVVAAEVAVERLPQPAVDAVAQADGVVPVLLPRQVRRLLQLRLLFLLFLELMARRRQADAAVVAEPVRQAVVDAVVELLLRQFLQAPQLS